MLLAAWSTESVALSVTLSVVSLVVVSEHMPPDNPLDPDLTFLLQFSRSRSGLALNSSP